MENDKKWGYTESDEIGASERRQDLLMTPFRSIFSFADQIDLCGMQSPIVGLNALDNLDRLIERDNQRQKDGFPKKIVINHIVKPGAKGSKDKIVIVPTTEEDKLYHGRMVYQNSSGGSGTEAEGEVIAEKNIDPDEGEPQDAGPGEGEGGSHEIEKEAYDLGKTLTEVFKLPNPRVTSKKSNTFTIQYDLVDRNKGSGQVLNKKATMMQIAKTNIALGNLSPEKIEPEELLVAPGDRVYNILAEQRIYDSKACVFFVRDYSGSMGGAPTDVICRMHLQIYSWLMYQYQKQVICRFILHDTAAKEVPDFFSYYNSNTGGGTYIAPAYEMVAEIINSENLAKDYNLYMFHGTDGDDWDKGGNHALDAIEEIMKYANRIGITVAKNSYGDLVSVVEKYFKNSELIDNVEKIRLDSFFAKEINEERLIQCIRYMLS